MSTGYGLCLFESQGSFACSEFFFLTFAFSLDTWPEGACGKKIFKGGENKERGGRENLSSN